MIARKYKKWKRTPTHLEKLRMAGAKVSPKSKFLALFFCFFFGIFGCHWLYLGRKARGLLMLFFAFCSVVILIGGTVGFFWAVGKEHRDGAEAVAYGLAGYYGAILSQFLYLLGMFILWLWSMVDFIWILFIGVKDGKGRAVKDW